MKRLVLLAALSVCLPGCLAAAAGGFAYVIGKDSEADAETKKARLEYMDKARQRGLSDEEILREIKLTDPEWYEEIVDEGGGLPEDRK